MPLPLLGVPANFRARFDKRPYWRCGYLDGRTVHETDGLDWALVPKEGMEWLELQCPNGKNYRVGNADGASYRLFQFKIAELRQDSGARTSAYIVGIVLDKQGKCRLWMWDSLKNEAIGPIEDRLPSLKIGGPVTQHMSLDVLGVKLEAA